MTEVDKKHKVVTKANNTNLFNLKKKYKGTKTKNRKNKNQQQQQQQQQQQEKTTTTANYQRLIQNTVKDRTFCENN